MAIATALASIPIMVGVGVVVDYLQASNMRTTVSALADAATLAGVSGKVMSQASSPERHKEQMAAATKAFFASQLDNKPALKSLVTSYDVTTSSENKVVTAKLCFSAEAKSSILSLSGKKTIPISGCSQASAKMPEYVSVYALIDASGSMGIGASIADQTQMQRRLGCTFACHNNNAESRVYAPNCNTFDHWSQTTRCAKAIGVKTRFDVARDALLAMVDTANSLTRMPNQFTFSVSKFSDKLNDVHANSSNLASVKAAVQAMELDDGQYRTDLRLALQQILPKMPVSGDGSSPSSPRVYLVVVTDGVENRLDDMGKPYSTFSGSLPSVSMGVVRLQAFNPAGCGPIKRKGVTIMMLNTEYSVAAERSDSILMQIKSLLVPGMKDQMKTCASKPDLALNATSGGQIQAASDRLFKEIAMKPELVR